MTKRQEDAFWINVSILLSARVEWFLREKLDACHVVQKCFRSQNFPFYCCFLIWRYSLRKCWLLPLNSPTTTTTKTCSRFLSQRQGWMYYLILLKLEIKSENFIWNLNSKNRPDWQNCVYVMSKIIYFCKIIWSKQITLFFPD